ncbi:hypothetical protein C1645_767517 [Glomus cerebriforme]|uniref:Uncharacterized protein n=1 Tax=Glomus cerebriforme TaxID=658196 RepID=A0A397T506_9GLOM|nr:hypothetical protein C1645_767517 [Glomus cerebriforme]
MKFPNFIITILVIFALTTVNALPIAQESEETQDPKAVKVEPVKVELMDLLSPQDTLPNSPDFTPEKNLITQNEKPVCSSDRTAKLYLESKVIDLCPLSTVCYDDELGAYCDV